MKPGTYMKGLIIAKLLLITIPFCMSSEYKISHCPSIEAATITASNN
ncbi:MAG: hypothetical protein JWQ84_1765 [Mucilaginibacter sp.]|nr:hypothetical protein [Mucilaginibacter sp.]